MCIVKKLSENRLRASKLLKRVIRAVFKKASSDLGNIQCIIDQSAEIAENEANEALASSILTIDGDEDLIPVNFAKTDSGVFFWDAQAATPVDRDLFAPPQQASRGHFPGQAAQA